MIDLETKFKVIQDTKAGHSDGCCSRSGGSQAPGPSAATLGSKGKAMEAVEGSASWRETRQTFEKGLCQTCRNFS